MNENPFGAEVGRKVSEYAAPDLSVSDMADHYAGVAARCLEATQFVARVVEVRAVPNQVHLTCRINPAKESGFIKEVAHAFLTAAESAGILDNFFVGKEYKLFEGKMRYAWVVAFGAGEGSLQDVVEIIGRALERFIPRVEVTQSPLMGPPTPEGAYGVKGAFPVRGGR